MNDDIFVDETTKYCAHIDIELTECKVMDKRF